MTDTREPERIWLAPACWKDERYWTDVPEDDCDEPGCGAKAVEYVRADLYDAALTAQRVAERERDAARVKALQDAVAAIQNEIDMAKASPLYTPGDRDLEQVIGGAEVAIRTIADLSLQAPAREQEAEHG